MIITISGTPGSGKSTIAKKLCESFSAERIYAGGMRRELARSKGLTLEQLNEYAKTHPETDVDIDKMVVERARAMNRLNKIVIVEGRVQYHFLAESLKLFIKVDPKIGAKRVWNEIQKDNADQRNEGKFSSLDVMTKRVVEREEEDALRYIKFYGIDHRDESQYDFVLDTSHLNIEQAFSKVKNFIDSKIKKS